MHEKSVLMVKRKKITYQNVATCPKEQGVTLIYGEYKLFIPRLKLACTGYDLKK